MKIETCFSRKPLGHFLPNIVCKLLRCCLISPDTVNGRRTDRKSAKNVYPVVKVVLVAMKVVAECVRSA